MARRLLAPLCLALAATLPGAACAAGTGTIAGTIDRAGAVKAVVAIDRATDTKFPGKVDPKTGEFTITGLPLGPAYDCIIDLGGAKLEGVNFTVPRSDFEEEQPLGKDDPKALADLAKSLNKFEDVVEVMAVRGNVQHAAVLLNKLRTTPFINSAPGEVIWRLELWHFEKPDDTWIKVQDELFLVLYRERLQKKDFDRKSLTLDPALGGLKPTAKKPRVELGKITLPSTEPGIRLRADN
jgi:hypothetical protein